jgi:hypothetical protein
MAPLANSLGHELVRVEAQRSTHSIDPDAMDLMMHGWSALWQQPTKESTSARDYLVPMMPSFTTFFLLKLTCAMPRLARPEHVQGIVGWRQDGNQT